MELSIIIANWNSAAYTAACISSIRAVAPRFGYEIIVVDNASSDDSLDHLEQVPDIQLIRSTTNLGFARANNLGFEHSSGDVLLFLNPDTKILGSAIDRMYDVLVSSGKVGIVGCRLLNSDHTLQTSCVQAFPTILNQLTDIEALKIRFPEVRMWGISTLFQPVTDFAPVEVVSGACLMIRRKIFEDVGLFSTDYFMYCEDVDLCHKVAAAGYQTGYVPDAMVIHYGGQSSKQARTSSFADVMGREAMRTFLAKRRSSVYARTYTCSIFLAAVLRLGLLGVLPPALLGTHRAGAAASRRKWKSILSWSLGGERWARQLGGSAENAGRATIAKVA
jgi:N-acetylglucosaminyl-diphospho-decaprenol L-rhamnosyltransferase